MVRLHTQGRKASILRAPPGDDDDLFHQIWNINTIAPAAPGWSDSYRASLFSSCCHIDIEVTALKPSTFYTDLKSLAQLQFCHIY
jgi:hypothetical protein